MKFLVRWFAFILTICVATACNDKTMYYSYTPTPSEGWEKNDTILFNIPINDSLTLLYLNTEVRSSNLYPYRDLWLEIRHNFKGNDTLDIDTLQFVLADEEGKRADQSWSCFYQKSKPLNPIFLKDSGMYVVKINHIMYDNNIKGIHDIGLHISK